MERTIPSTKHDLDAAARAAAKTKKAKPDLMKVGVPFDPATWQILVEPLEPKEMSAGGIILAAISQEAESYQITIGRVLKCGPTAFEGETKSGIKLSDFTDKIKTPKQLIGKYVVYQRYTGQGMVLRDHEQKLIVLTVSEILGVTDKPDAWRSYI